MAKIERTINKGSPGKRKLSLALSVSALVLLTSALNDILPSMARRFMMRRSILSKLPLTMVATKEGLDKQIDADLALASMNWIWRDLDSRGRILNKKEREALSNRNDWTVDH